MIMAAKHHKAELRVYRNKIMYRKMVKWSNTNKLLGVMGCRGLKTGFTARAGGCLSTVFETEFEGMRGLFVIVLGCRTQEHRFIDTTKLVEWAIDQENQMTFR
jgi:D-alanyl-D-alanine carboxypeptidase